LKEIFTFYNRFRPNISRAIVVFLILPELFCNPDFKEVINEVIETTMTDNLEYNLCPERPLNSAL